MRVRIQHIKANPATFLGKEIEVKGWVRTVRAQKNFSFIELNDGSCLSNLQVIAPENIEGVTTGAALAITGTLVESPGNKQSIEMQSSKIIVIGTCDPQDYPLQKKRHSLEFLRSIAHLRPRTNTISAAMRVRNQLAYATHRFFQDRGFVYLHTPIITPSDCEGAGQLFQVTTTDGEDFFGQKAYLTVSGQLNGEIYASALSDIYTFGPTFRAENSNTSRHLAEFWMIEPEMAFADLKEDMDLAESYLKTLFQHVLDNCEEDMAFFNQWICQTALQRLESVVKEPFARISYTESVDLLKKSGQNFEFPINWGCDLQSEHERYLCETHFKKPVIVHDYPATIKPFYMRQNDDEKTVANMDVLVPGVGEIIGGSQREERFDVLNAKMDKAELDKSHYWWYLELRKYGSVPHSGFGAGFERLVLFTTGMENIRDAIPFPRYPGYAAF